MGNSVSIWRKPIFRFFSSVRLAVVLLGVLILASLAGTIYESRFDAEVARAYIYEAVWFNIWLLLLVVNLTAAALSRRPWKRRHIGFVITHLGIIVLLAGAFIGKIWGIEGTMTIFEGHEPVNELVTDKREIRVEEKGWINRVTPFVFVPRKGTEFRKKEVAVTSNGWVFEIVGYSSSLTSKTEAVELGKAEKGIPSVHVTLSTAMMKQKLDAWLLADDPKEGLFDLGLASVSF